MLQKQHTGIHTDHRCNVQNIQSGQPASTETANTIRSGPKK